MHSRKFLTPDLKPVRSGQANHGKYNQRGWYSQIGQDRCVDAIFAGSRTRGYYVDLAANDAYRLSNTYYLDRNLSWAGLCIEPNPIYLEGLLSERTCDVAKAVISNRSSDHVTEGDRSGQPGTTTRFRFAGESGGILSTLEGEMRLKDLIKSRWETHYKGKPFRSENARRAAIQYRLDHSLGNFATVQTVGIAPLLRAVGAPSRIDYLSLDVRVVDPNSNTLTHVTALLASHRSLPTYLQRVRRQSVHACTG